MAIESPFAGLSCYPGVVRITEEEKASGEFSQANLQLAMELMHRDGALVLENAVELEGLKRLADSMMKTAAEIKSTKTETNMFNHGLRTNFLMSPDLSDPTLQLKDVYQNPFCIAVAESYLGPGIRQAFVTSNVAMAGTTERQMLHADAPFIYPAAPYSVNNQFMMCDFTPENGATEFLLGTHNTSHPLLQYFESEESENPLCAVTKEAVAERSLFRKPAQVYAKFGSIVVRDLRTWHAGMPNQTNKDRIMLGLNYEAKWYPNRGTFQAPKTAEPLLTSNEPRVKCMAHFIEDDEWRKTCQDWFPGGAQALPGLVDPETWQSLHKLPPNAVKTIIPSGAAK